MVRFVSAIYESLFLVDPVREPPYNGLSDSMGSHDNTVVST